MGRDSHNSYQASSDPRFWFDSALDDAGLSVLEFRVYLHFVRLEGPEGLAEAGAREIAKTCCISRGAAANAINGLVKRGAIERIVSRRGPGWPDKYHVLERKAWINRSPGGRLELFPEGTVHHMDGNRPPGGRANINKIKKKKEIGPPSLTEFVAYAVQNKISESDAKEQFEAWEAGEWHDGKGNKIERWKLKLLTFRNNKWLPSHKRASNPQPPPKMIRDSLGRLVRRPPPPA